MSDSPYSLAILTDVKAALEAAYQAGFKAGDAAARIGMRAALAAHLDQPTGDRGAKTSNETADQATSQQAEAPPNGGRVPRGSVRIAVQKALGRKPGQSTQEIVEMVSKIDPNISSTSVATELRRHSRPQGDIYKIRGGLWYIAD